MTVDSRPKSDSDTCHENLLVPSAAEIGKSSSCIYQVEKLPQLLFPFTRYDLKASEEEMLKFGFRWRIQQDLFSCCLLHVLLESQSSCH